MKQVFQRSAVVGLFWMASTLAVEAQYSNVASVINGFGGRSTGGAYTHIGAGAQPGGIGVSYWNF